MKLTDHPFLATTQTWQSAGIRVDDGVKSPIEGRVTVARTDAGWDIRTSPAEGRASTSLPAVRYDVRPPRQRGERADWIAVDPRYGRLIGQFVAVDDSISSTFVSTDGRYSGSEWMILDGGRYRSRGVVLQDGELVCRWSTWVSCGPAVVDARNVAAVAAELESRPYRFAAIGGASVSP
jgi:hypothetical protein